MYEGTPIEDKRRDLKAIALYGALSLLLAGILAFSATSKLQNSASQLTKLNSKFQDATGTLKLEAVNKYSARDGTPGQQYPWLKDSLLAEPHQPSTFRVVHHDPTREYEWELYDGTNLEQKFTGHEFVYSFEREHVWNDNFILVVNEYETDADDHARSITDSASAQVYVRYVRREIRTLFPEDRDEVLDTMALHWKISQKAGVELYGSRYRSMLTLLKMHLSGAGDKECDHFHDGFGFLQQHSALTILFEQSMQAVNPRLALPYWDYVKDMELFTQAGEGFAGFNNGELFTAAVFGATDADDHIADGRWAGLAMPTVADLDGDLQRSQIPHNAFGFLRSPWSNNADAPVVRSSMTCGVDGYNANYAADCAELAALTAQGSFYDWFSYASYKPHGPVHVLLGGALGCAEAWDAVEASGVDPSLVPHWRGNTFAYLKNAYRLELMECASTDGCYCLDYDSYLASAEAASNFLGAIGMTSIGDLTFAQAATIVDAVCNSGMVLGDNLQSSSSWTPEFWPIHGNVERMYQLRLLRGGWEGDEFAWDTASWAPSQINCSGHFAEDPLLLGRDAVQVRGATAELRVRESLDLLDADGMKALDYVYDNVDFEYCGLTVG